MHLKQLRIFCTAVQLKNFTHTARQLRISQPSVSLQLKKLEEDYGVQLFDRTGRNNDLTAQGKILYEYAQRILALVEECEKQVSSSRSLQMKRLTIAGTLLSTSWFLPMALVGFMERNRGIHCSLLTGSNAQVEEWVLKGIVDLGLMSLKPASRDLMFEEYLKDQLVVITNSSHPLSRRKKLRFEDLKGIPLIQRGKGTRVRDIVEKEFEARGLPLTIGLEANTTDAIRSAVAANLGMAFFPRSMVELEVATKKLKILPIEDLKVDVQAYLVYRKGKPLASLTRNFLRCLQENKTAVSSQSV